MEPKDVQVCNMYWYIAKTAETKEIVEDVIEDNCPREKNGPQ